MEPLDLQGQLAKDGNRTNTCGGSLDMYLSSMLTGHLSPASGNA